MIKDLNYPVDMIVCQTIREPDGLAMSSRNARLSPSARKQAACLYQALQVAKTAYKNGERDAATLKSKMMDVVDSADIERIDYASVADLESFEELDHISDGALLSLAVVVDGVRLIDNVVVDQ